VTRTLDAIILAGIAASIGIGSCVDCSTRPAEAQDRRTVLRAALLERQQSLVLARVCVSEGGWANPDACAAYHTALRASAGAVPGLEWDTHARKYTKLFDAHRPPTRLWLLGLGESTAAPVGWPRQLPWRTRYLPLWLTEVDVALELVRHPRNPCEGTPTDWASSAARIAVYKTEHPQAVEIDCPGEDRFFRASPEAAR
jgi:hypothetical protein